MINQRLLLSHLPKSWQSHCLEPLCIPILGGANDMNITIKSTLCPKEGNCLMQDICIAIALFGIIATKFWASLKKVIKNDASHCFEQFLQVQL